MKPARPYRLLRLLALVLALHLGALALILTAATPCANAVLPKPSPRASASERESPARPGCNPAPTGDFNAQRSTFNAQRSMSGTPSFSVKSSALNVKSSGASAPASNPATAGSRLSSGPGSLSVFYPVKQNGAPNLAPTLPAVAG